MDDEKKPDEQPISKQDIEKVVDELQKLNSSRVVQASESLTKLLAFQFMKGVFMGLGSIIGVGILLSGFAYLLAQIELIPIIGDFVKDTITYVLPDYQGSAALLSPQETGEPATVVLSDEVTGEGVSASEQNSSASNSTESTTTEGSAEQESNK